MRFLANENIPKSSVNYLRDIGIDIKSIGIEYSGISDKSVMKIAIDEQRTIITYDSDYGELIFKHQYKPEAGVIYLRNQPTYPLETAEIIERLISTQNLIYRRRLTVIDSNSIRQKIY